MTGRLSRPSDGEWFVVVLTDHRGKIAATVWYGRDPDDAPEAIARADQDRGMRWLVYAERGFAQHHEAETRAAAIRAEVGAKSTRVAGREASRILH